MSLRYINFLLELYKIFNLNSENNNILQFIEIKDLGFYDNLNFIKYFYN
jgi:hypothetical protein